MKPIYAKEYEFAAQLHAMYIARGARLKPMTAMADIPDPIFSVGDKVEVRLENVMRQGVVLSITLSYDALWSYEIKTCDTKPELRTIKHECNWDATGKWSGGGSFASIKSAIEASVSKN